MRLRHCALLVGASLTLAACATVAPNPHSEPAWAWDPLGEVERFHASGKPLETYFEHKTAATPAPQRVYAAAFCDGLMQVSDQHNAVRCIDAFKALSRANREALEAYVAERSSGPQNAVTRALKTKDSETIRSMVMPQHERGFGRQEAILSVRMNEFLLEQGRYAEVIDNLQPVFDRESAALTLSTDKETAYFLKSMAMPILVKAQKANGGLSENVARFLEESESAHGLNTLTAAFSLRSRALGKAYVHWARGDYARCHAEVAESSLLKHTDVGLLSLLKLPLDALYGGDISRMQQLQAVEWLRYQSYCAYEAGLHDEAARSYEEILALAGQRLIPLGLVRVAHHRLGLLALRRGEAATAITHLQAAVDILEKERAALDSEAGRMGYASDKGEVYRVLVAQLVAAGRHAEAFEYAERAKARALVDVLASRQAGGATIGGRLAAARERFDRAYFSSQLEDLKAETRGGGTRKASAAALQTLAGDSAELSSLLSVPSVRASEVQQRLAADETLLEYYGEGDTLIVFVVTREALVAKALDAAAVNRQLPRFRRQLQDPRASGVGVAARAAYDLLVRPVQGSLRTGSVTVVPHGALHYIPFAALHDGKGYWVASRELRTLPSASVLAFIDKPLPPKAGALLVLGNPDLGDPQADLPGAQAESTAVSRLVPESKLLLRKAASESAFRRAAPSYRELHLAMHGRFDPADPMASGLYMSKDGEHDGVLTVAELYGLELKVDTVVLSACETALADVSKGDDLVGLSRGFLFAGVNSIVASLWEVDDRATKDMMVEYYRGRSGKRKAAALRQAQLKVMKQYPHPFYWSAFQLTGAS